MDLDAYFTRVNVNKDSPPTVETLRRIHVAHLEAFPFHNLQIQRGGSVRVDLDSVITKFLGDQGGGYCFEQNTLLGAALEALGFKVTTLMGRVGEHALNHMLLRVDVDGRPWLADVGFGAEGPLEPLPIEDGVRVRQDGVDFSLRRAGNEWTFTMHYGDVSEELYRFSDVPFRAGDVEMANYYTSTWPSSIFRHTLTIQKITTKERVILRPKILTVYRDGTRVDTPIEPAQLRPLALEHFGYDLGDTKLLFEEEP
jgi:N-hydroxyarylamine O-acetyltransferase